MSIAPRGKCPSWFVRNTTRDFELEFCIGLRSSIALLRSGLGGRRPETPFHYNWLLLSGNAAVRI
jgi:hypothetical protein